METQSKFTLTRTSLLQILLVPIVVSTLYICSLYSYPLFHIITEDFAIIIGVCAFIVVWNTRKIADKKNFLFIGIFFLFVSFLDFVHALSYKGMGIFKGIDESNVATQLWIAARYLQSISLLFTVLFVWRAKSLKIGLTLLIYSTITTLIILSIFIWRIFPACFIVGTGLTPFKKTSEYIISLILLATIVVIYSRQFPLDKTIKRFFLLSLIANIISEISFIFYVSVFGFSNFVGHIVRIFACYFLYQATVKSTLTNPFDFLFYELNKNRNALEVAKIEAEKERDRSEIYLQSINDGVIAIDKEWRITLWNKAAETISGYSRAEAIGKNFRKVVKIIREHDRKESILFIENIFVFGKTENVSENILLINKDGNEIPISESGAPIFNKQGGVSGVIIIFHDSTREKEAARLHSSFAYASHQLRTPITKAMWTMEGILRESNIEKIKTNVIKSYQALESVNKLSEELVKVSEIDQDMVVSTIETIKLIDLWNDLIQEIKEKIAKHEVKIISPSIPTALYIDTSLKLLKTALSEIIDNAIIYSSKGSEIKVVISKNEDTLLFEVQDSGIGINADQQPLAFAKFFRGSNFDTSEIAGAGLGLYIAKEYIKLLKGKIWFNTEPKKGSTFYISIPLSTGTPS